MPLSTVPWPTARTPELAGVYRRLAEAEERHATFWEDKLTPAGVTLPDRRPGWRARVMAWVARRAGAAVVLPTVAAAEHTNRGMYDQQPETEQTTMRGDERSHARLLAAVAGPTSRGMSGEAIARLEGRHRTVGGNTLRAAVLGANDGLVSNLALVMGVAGAGLAQDAVVVTGLAGLLAGAGSMAMGEWISVQSAREQAGRQLRIEADELAAFPEEEAEELTLIYQAKGLPEDQARGLASRLLADDDQALSVLANEELGIDPNDLGGSPWTAAITSFLLFAVGAIVPLVPYFIPGGRWRRDRQRHGQRAGPRRARRRHHRLHRPQRVALRPAPTRDRARRRWADLRAGNASRCLAGWMIPTGSLLVPRAVPAVP